MFRKTIDGIQIRVWFEHNEKRRSSRTVCYTECKKDGVLLQDSRATVRKHSTDKHNRSVARKYALAKALTSLPKGFRTEIWKEYHIRSSGNAMPNVQSGINDNGGYQAPSHSEDETRSPQQSIQS